MIIFDGEVTFEVHTDHENKLYFIIHNNMEGLSILEYQELTIDISNDQAREVIKHLTEFVDGASVGKIGQEE